MKKIVLLTIAFLAIALVPQSVMAQETVEPAKKEVKKKAKKGEVVPIDQKPTIVAKKGKKKADKVVKKEGSQNTQTTSPRQNSRGYTPSTDKPRDVVLKPIKNPKENKVTVGKKMDKKKNKKDKKKMQVVKKMD